MADSATQVQAVTALLREWGFTVHEVGGWENRGSGTLTTAGRLEHHTAGARSGDTPSLRVVTFGRAGLRNSLCRWYVSRSGVIYLVARKASWHAGRGGKGSNSTLSGTEAENSGTGEAWTPRSLEAQAAISAAECRVFGVSPSRIWDHKEHAPSRKVDRYGIDPASWRERVAAVLGGTPPEQEDDETMRYDERSKRVEEWQHALNLCLYLTGGEFNGGGNAHDRNGSHLKVDGHLGGKTVEAASHAIGRLQIRLKRRSFYVDVSNPSPVLVAYVCAENVRMLAANKAA